MSCPAIPIFSLLVALFLVGCVSTIDSKYCIELVSPLEKVNRANLDYTFKEIAKEICDSKDKVVMIPDFLEVQSLSTGAIGLLLGEVMRSSYSQVCKSKIIQIEFPKHFKISKEGVISLSRNPNDLKKAEHTTNEVIIGTFSYTEDILRIFVRKVDVDTGHIIKMISKEIKLSSCKRQF